MVAFSHPGYVFAGWGISLVVLAGYALRTILRGKRLARQVPPEERRWT
jgi:heme exporter protein D